MQWIADILLGAAIGLAVSLWWLKGTFDRAYQLGVKHGRELEVLEQWGADVREALAVSSKGGSKNG